MVVSIIVFATISPNAELRNVMLLQEDSLLFGGETAAEVINAVTGLGEVRRQFQDGFPMKWDTGLEQLSRGTNKKTR